MNRLKILYLGCHEILEYDDLSMFTSLGHSVFSTDGFGSPDYPGTFRPAKPGFSTEGDYAAYTASGSAGPTKIAPDFAARFDVAIVINHVNWAEAALEYMGGRPVIYRSIGQSSPGTEAQLSHIRDGLTVVRYSESEVSLPGFVSSDAVIYFGKDSAEFGDRWMGGDRFITFHNTYRARAHASAPSVAQYEALAASFPMDLFGAQNDGIVGDGGLLPAERQANVLRRAAGYFYIPTVPPSYTLSFIEAAGVGTPVIAPSADFISSVVDRSFLAGSGFSADRWEVPRLLGEDSGLIYDDIDGARGVLERLRSDQAFAQKSSAKMREIFQKRFDATRIAQQWGELLNRVTAGASKIA